MSLIKTAERTAYILFSPLSPVPFSLTGPVILAFFAAIQLFRFFLKHRLSGFQKINTLMI